MVELAEDDHVDIMLKSKAGFANLVVKSVSKLFRFLVIARSSEDDR